MANDGDFVAFDQFGGWEGHRAREWIGRHDGFSRQIRKQSALSVRFFAERPFTDSFAAGRAIFEAIMAKRPQVRLEA